ncbi:hypothetical protein SOVF_109740 [Spinacia oleracea]|uniref:WUSCHEL-related homeobox 1 n=1 Tax=Spinacia oleracea TaxID=3562 RepID=A0A9R0I8Y5_SPIOL|nr:WUSCHEL-related homeobox 1-like [Spinacia oleracea]KNA14206.1 hypothetical protein SOVF_109740 [Spinacia oleracea]
MMGYNEVANQDLNLGDPFKGSRKLRPLVPRPYLSSPPNHHNVNTTCLTGFHNPTSHHHLFSFNNTAATLNHHHNHHPHFVGPEEGKETVGTHQVMVSSRWNPTPEQLRALEELYRRGTRTPSADQIQHITAQLRRYGKIEGKNVFYWFQNHKARERQKRRRQLQLPLPPSSGSSSGGNRIGFEVEQKSSKWAPSSTNKEEDHSDPATQIAEETGLSKATATTEMMIQFHQSPEFQHNHNINHNNIMTNNFNINSTAATNLLFAAEKNSTWQTHNNNNMMVQPSSCSCCCYPSPPPPSLPLFSLSSKPNYNSSSNIITASKGGNNLFGRLGESPSASSSPTLQLFPVEKDDDEDEDEDEDNSCVTCNDDKAMPSNNPFPYYEFL